MARIGRNDPCPCGSGRKYKRCCLAKEGGVGFTGQERLEALAKLDEMLAGEWVEVEEEAEGDFWGPFLDRRGQADPTVEQASAMLFEFWFFFDFMLEPRYHLVDAFLEAEPDLSPGERQYLLTARETAMRPYEVAGMDPGTSVTLRPLLAGSDVEVHDRAASHTLQRSDLIVARVMSAGASGEPELDGPTLQIDPSRRDELVAMVEKVLGEHGAELGELGCYKELGRFFHQLWLASL